MDGMKEYEELLASVCYYSVRLALVKVKIADGEVVEEKMDVLCSRLEESIEKFLEVKKKLGFTDGLAFLDDICLAGFSMKDGILIGDLSNLENICDPWIVKFPETRENYKFELAYYLFTYQLRLEEVERNKALVMSDERLAKLRYKRKGNFFVRLKESLKEKMSDRFN